MEDQENAKKRFRDWVKTKVPDAEYMNICSGPQVTRPAVTPHNHRIVNRVSSRFSW